MSDMDATRDALAAARIDADEFVRIQDRAVEEAMLDARLEIPKALGAQARVPSIAKGGRLRTLECG